MTKLSEPSQRKEKSINNLNSLILFHQSEFESADTSKYDFIIVDPWTWAAQGLNIIILKLKLKLRV